MHTAKAGGKITRATALSQLRLAKADHGWKMDPTSMRGGPLSSKSSWRNQALKRNRTINRILMGLLGIAATAGGAWIITDWFHEQQMKRRMDAHVREIIGILSLENTPGFHQRIDKLRTFINDNSTHKIDQAFWANRGNPAAFAGGVLAYAKGLSPERVHMECSTRSSLMTSVLQALGYETRMVAVFDSRTNLRSHSFLEVMNPETGIWETQDPDYDIYWRMANSAKRVSLADNAEHVDQIEPCGRKFCGWPHVSREGIRAAKLRAYLDIISISDKDRAIRYALYTSRAELRATYKKSSKEGSFCEVEAKRCRHGFYDIRKYSTYAAGTLR